MYLTQGLHRAVEQSPSGSMLVGEGLTFSFREVRERVARLAGGLRTLGVRRDDRVAILSLNSLHYTEMLLAVPWADGVLVPVNTRWSTAEIVYALNDAGATHLFVDDTFASSVATIVSQCEGLKAVVHQGREAASGVVAYEDLIDEHKPIADAHRSGDDLAGLFYTGGTTGHPKGVMLTQRNLMTSTLAGAAAGSLFGRGSRYLHVAPMFHLADLFAWNLVMVGGGTHYAIPSFEPERVLQLIEEHRIQGTTLVPTMIQMLTDHEDAAHRVLSSLEVVLYGAAPISMALLRRALAAFPAARFTQAYGMTEAAAAVTLLMPEDHNVEGRRTSAGRPMLHTDIRIVDETGTEADRGVIGEITLRSDSVMLGYWNRPDETHAVLRDGWYFSGDAGYMDDNGYVFAVDRLKDLIITGGENVYSVEVENAISSHPAVHSCAVIGIPDEKWGETVHAVVIRKPATQVTEAEIRDHARALIAGYKVPRSVDFVDSIPVSPAGKILKRELRSTYRAMAERRGVGGRTNLA
ncbi:fatty-acid--CoA ligase [Rhodococcus opacus]|uniref:Fatty-acid--CoA ligase n=1 Tax=Rhodococcus opacus TaxID=37919 RepID=A0A2S8IZE4_RHOOP|nr:fatty-acid--CoA ligase [Rhodococcus opacus]